MKWLRFFVVAACATSRHPKAVQATAPIETAIWPGTVPDAVPLAGPENKLSTSENLIGGKPITALENVAHPTMTVYAPTTHNTGAAVVVFPGGGYKMLAIDLEGSEVCTWLIAIGVTCVVLKYRVPFSGPHWDKACDCHVVPPVLTALEDAQRTIGILRSRAAEFHIDPKKIGVLGFSAGGHLVAATSTNATRIYKAVDAADSQSCRPDFAIALYPGHLWNDDEKKFELMPEIATKVTHDVPPTLIFQATDDETDSVNHSLVYYRALIAADVSVEMHLFAHGGHAFGLRSTNGTVAQWPRLAESWMHSIGVI